MSRIQRSMKKGQARDRASSCDEASVVFALFRLDVERRPTAAGALHDFGSTSKGMIVAPNSKGRFATCDRPSHNRRPLGSSDVLSLPPVRSLCDLKLYFLAFLQVLEAARLDSREVHENVFAILAADKTVAFGVVKPLYCAMFHVTGVPSISPTTR